MRRSCPDRGVPGAKRIVFRAQCETFSPDNVVCVSTRNRAGVLPVERGRCDAKLSALHHTDVEMIRPIPGHEFGLMRANERKPCR